MERLSIRSIAFFVALSVGTLATWVVFFEPNRPAIPDEQNTAQISPSDSEDPISLESLEIFDDKKFQPNSFSCQILETGPSFHADQISAKTGETWLGVFDVDGTFTLRPATLQVKRVKDEILHGPNAEDKGKLTGKSVSVAGTTKPLFLVKNSRRLQPGPITTLFVGQREDHENESTKPTVLDKNFHQSYELTGKTYELKVVKARNTQGDPILALLLEGDGNRQLLHTFWTRGEGEIGEKDWLGSVGTLYWAGDIDRDNKPDFYLSLFAHETIYEAYLLLSSEADKGDLVKEVGLFSTSGCG